MMKTRKRLAMAWIIAALIPLPAAAGDGNTDGANTLVMEPMTVTANKIEETVADIPQSVSIIDEATVREKDIHNVEEIIAEVPNLTTTFIYSSDVNFRGINSSIFTNDNPVVLYIDGIPQSNRLAYDASLEDAERVEVLRGPQGTLYGKNAIGGVINIVTRSASNETRGSVGLEYGSFGAMQGQFNVSGPILEDTLFFGVNGFLYHEDGWITNHRQGMDEKADEKDEQKFGANLTFTPTERLSAKLSAFSDVQKDEWIRGLIVPTGSPVSDYSREDAEDAGFDVDTFTETESVSQALNVGYDFDAATLTSVTTHKKSDLDGYYDMDWGDIASMDGSYSFQCVTMENSSQELRLASRDAATLRWVGGVYYENDVYNNDRYGMQYAVYDLDYDAVSEITSNTSAVFGQVMLPLKDALELTLGGRYQHLEKEIDLSYYCLPIGMSGPPAVIYRDKTDWDAFLPKVGLTWQVDDTLTAFASVAAGYMPGGFNYFPSTSSSEENRFDPQTSVNYEVGLKKTASRLYLSASLFYMDIEDVHVYSYDLVTNTNRTSNAAAGHSMGAELDFNWLLGSRWKLTGAVGVIEAQYDAYSSASADGNTIERTPAYTVSGGLSYTDPEGWYGRLDVTGKGDTYFDAANTLKGDAYMIGNLKIGRTLGPWNIYAAVENIADEEYILSEAEQMFGTIVSYGDPRSFTAGVQYSF